MTNDQQPTTRLSRLAWLPVPLFLAAMVVLWAADLRTPHESQFLLTVFNFLFSTVASLLVTVLVGRTYLVRGSPGLLLLGCGVLIWGAAGTLVPVLFPYGTNVLIGGHNSLVWFSALCHLAGVLSSAKRVSPRSSTFVANFVANFVGGFVGKKSDKVRDRVRDKEGDRQIPRRADLTLATAYAGTLCLVWLVVLLAMQGWMPVFFVQGQGGTPLRAFVLGSAIVMFALTAAVLWRANRPSPSAFVRWYGAALLLVATGLLGVMLEQVHGGALSWTGRAAQFLGGAYMLAAAIASVRETGVRGVTLATALRETEERYRSLVELSPEAIIVHQDGRFVFANPAALRLYGASTAAELLGRPVLDLIHPDDRERVRSRMESSLGGARTRLLEVRALRLDGRTLYVESTGAPVDFGGRPAVQVVIRDVTERKRAEARLAQQAFMLDNVTDAVIGFDMDYRITFWGRSAERMFGYTAAEVVGKAGIEVLRPTYVGMTREEVRVRLARNGYLEVEFIEYTKDGRALSVDTRTQVLRNDRGEPIGMVAVNRDIAERKRAEEVLRRNQEELALKNAQLQGLFDYSAASLVLFDAKPPYTVLAHNKYYQQLWGEPFRTHGMIGKNLLDYVPNVEAEGVMAVFDEVVRTRSARNLIGFPYDGMERGRTWWNWHLSPIMDGDKVVALAHMGIDVTEAKRAEESLRQSREDMDRAQVVGNMGWWRLDTRTNVLTWSAENHRIFGVPEGTPMSYEFFLSTVHPDDRQYVDTRWAAGLRGEPYDIEHRILVGGQVKWVREKAYLEFDNEGKLLGGFGITQDITPRKEAQAALDRVRVMLAEGQKVAHVGSWEYLADTRTTVWSEEQCRIYGIDPAVGSPPYDVMLAKHIHPDDATALHETFATALRNREVYEQEHRIVRPDGSVRVLYERALPYFDEGGKLIKYVGASLDITERKAAEEALRESERLYRAIGESIDYGIWVCDAQGRNTYASESFLKLVGITQEQCSGLGWGDVLHPDDVEATIAAWKECVQKGGPWYREHRYRGVDGKWHPILACGVAVRNDRGEVTAWAGINLDISRMKQAEESLLASLHEKEVLLKEVHHRVKNNLQVISSLVSLQAETLTDPGLREVFEDVRDRVRSMALVHETLYQSENLAQVDLAEYAESLLHELWRGHRGAAAVNLNLALEPVALSVETAVPCGLILNELASNALRHAFKGRAGGEVTAALARDAATGTLRLMVRDNGVGLPDGFDWRNAKSLGLRLVQMLAKQMGGTVEARKAERGGAEFRVEFGEGH